MAEDRWVYFHEYQSQFALTTELINKINKLQVDLDSLLKQQEETKGKLMNDKTEVLDTSADVDAVSLEAFFDEAAKAKDSEEIVVQTDEDTAADVTE